MAKAMVIYFFLWLSFLTLALPWMYSFQNHFSSLRLWTCFETSAVAHWLSALRMRQVWKFVSYFQVCLEQNLSWSEVGNRISEILHLWLTQLPSVGYTLPLYLFHAFCRTNSRDVSWIEKWTICQGFPSSQTEWSGSSAMQTWRSTSLNGRQIPLGSSMLHRGSRSHLSLL